MEQDGAGWGEEPQQGEDVNKCVRKACGDLRYEVFFLETLLAVKPIDVVPLMWIKGFWRQTDQDERSARNRRKKLTVIRLEDEHDNKTGRTTPTPWRGRRASLFWRFRWRTDGGRAVAATR